MDYKKIGLKVWALIIITIFVGGIAAIYAYDTYFTEIPTSGTIPPVAAILVSTPPTIDWGTLYRGGSFTETVILENTSENVTDRVIDLELTTDGWTNTTDLGLTLDWDYTGTDIYPGYDVEVTFTLEVASTASSGDFDFSILLTPTLG